MIYLTDGVRLYEVAAQRVVQNYGRIRGKISYTILRDCKTGDARKVTDLELATLTRIRPQI